MSVASVLERSGNVRDIDQILPKEVKPWELNPENALSHLEGFEHFAAILLPEISSYEEAKARGRQLLRIYNSETDVFSHFSERTSVAKADNRVVRLGEFMGVMASAKLLLGNSTTDYDGIEMPQEYLPWDRLGSIVDHDMQRILEIDDREQYKDVGYHATLKLLWDIKICDPTIDVSEEARSLADLDKSIFGLSFEDANVFSFNNLVSRMEHVVALRMIDPEYFEGIDIVNTPFYKKAFYYWKNGNPALSNTLDLLAAGLKVLAAKDISIDDSGFHLSLNDDLPQVPLSSVPEIRRFDS
jgi:hypothetical protein